MKYQTIEMTEGSLAPNILQFTIPVMLMAMSQILFIACDDMLILGLFVGSKALAAVGATNYLVNLFVNAFLGLSIGVNVIVAQYVGAKDSEKAGQTVHTAIASGMVFGVILLVLGFVCSRICLEAMNTPSDIINQSTLYLRIYFFSTPATLIFNFGSAILRAQGDSKHPFLFLTVAGVADIALNTFFVTVFRMGVAGVALGTVLSQILAAVLVLRHLIKEKGMCKLSLRKLKIHKEVFFQILRLGIPAGLNNMVFSISNIQIQSAINLFGSSAVAGCSASSTVEGFVYAATNSVMQAAVSFTGQNTGAKKYENVPKILRWCLLYTSVIGTVLGGLTYLLGRPVLSLFIGAEDIEYAMLRNGIVLLPYMFCGMMETFAGTLRGLGKSIMPTLVTLIGACGFRILWVYVVFPAYRTLEVLFLCFPVSWILTTIAHYICYHVVIHRYKDIA